MKSLCRSIQFSRCLSLGLLLLSFLVVEGADVCAPVRWTENLRRGPPQVPNPVQSKMMMARSLILDADTLPGEITCRAPGHTGAVVNYYTCKWLANFYQITTDKFFWLNPTVKRDCSNILPNTVYCVEGFIEPVRATDGLCGPPHNDATCLGQPMGQCCNAATWKCGDTLDDCIPGNCYEGACPGDKIFSTDGTCGAEHGNRQCMGKWGNCCNMAGFCGNGTDFCGADVCQMGKCTWPVVVPPAVGNTTDGTCGGPKSFTCNVLYGTCCNSQGRCGSFPADCGVGCQPKWGQCSPVSSTTTTTTTKPSTTSSATSTSTTACTTTKPSSPKETWKSLGCYFDTGTPHGLLNKASTPAETQMTVEGCQGSCKTSGFSLAGLRYGKSCFCDNTIKTVPSNYQLCNALCTGNAKQICGGTDRLNVYQFSILQPQYNKVGCYVDAGTGKRTLRTFINVYGGDSANTVTACARECDDRGFPYSGTEAAVECWCDSAIQSVAVLAPEGAAGCATPCKGNATEICGGAKRISVSVRVPW